MTREEALEGVERAVFDMDLSWSERQSAALRVFREFERSVLERAAKAADKLTDDLAEAGKGFGRDEPGNPRAQFMAMATGARDAGRAIRKLAEEL